jgi:hypothetical protein
VPAADSATGWVTTAPAAVAAPETAGAPSGPVTVTSRSSTDPEKVRSTAGSGAVTVLPSAGVADASSVCACAAVAVPSTRHSAAVTTASRPRSRFGRVGDSFTDRLSGRVC